MSPCVSSAVAPTCNRGTSETLFLISTLSDGHRGRSSAKISTRGYQNSLYESGDTVVLDLTLDRTELDGPDIKRTLYPHPIHHCPLINNLVSRSLSLNHPVTMKLSALLSLISLAAALPSARKSQHASNGPFGVVAARSASPIHYLPLTARGGHFWLGGHSDTYCPSDVVPNCYQQNDTIIIDQHALVSPNTFPNPTGKKS